MTMSEPSEEELLAWVAKLAGEMYAEMVAQSRITGKPVVRILKEIEADWEERRQRGFGPRE